MSWSLRRDDAELRQVAPQRVDRLRALAYQKVACVEQHSLGLLFFFPLRRHEAHRPALRRLAASPGLRSGDHGQLERSIHPVAAERHSGADVSRGNSSTNSPQPTSARLRS